jgi:hypothetical protein
MKSRLSALATVSLAALLPVAAAAHSKPIPRYVVLPNHVNLAPIHPAAELTQWNGSFTDLTHKNITYTMVGSNPTNTNTTTTISVVLVPVKMVYGSRNGNMTFDPVAHTLSNGRTVVQNTLDSPLFNAGIDFNQGGTDLGNTQYEDAFQRGNFWSSVSTNSSYHVLLGTPSVATEQSITVTASQGKVINNPFGSGKVGEMNINSFDSKLQTFMKNLTQINPGVLPIFLTYDIYLTSGGCCIGGYHSANGTQPTGQTYAYSTYVDTSGAFAQDVSALSHELGEWLDDPFVDNRVNCTDNSLMEVGDPLEGLSNYGAFPYTLNSFTYNLQSLVFIGYFGAPQSTSVNSWLAFQNDESHVCPGQ